MLRRAASRLLGGPLAFALVLSAALPARAAIITLTPGQFQGASLVTFTGLTDGTSINGMTVGGVLFNFLENNVASADLVVDGGPGVTNNVAPPNLVTIGTNVAALLRLTFPAPQERLGYGFALLNTVVIPNATTVSLFDASNVMVGTLSANGVPDPGFTGGFLGLLSTIPFTRADITFSTAAPAFAFDNLRFAPPATTIPEPATLGLLGIALTGAAARRLRRRRV